MSFPNIKIRTKYINRAGEAMESIFFTLQDFFTHTKGVVYVLIILSLLALAGFWDFLNARDDD